MAFLFINAKRYNQKKLNSILCFLLLSIFSPNIYCQTNCGGGEGNGSPGGGNENSGSNWGVPIQQSYDPNDIVPPASIGDAGWVRRDQELPFMIRVENDPDSATAAVQVLWVYYIIPQHVDINSFEIGDLGFGDYYVQVPSGLQSFSTQVDATATTDLLVNVEVGISNDTVSWFLESIDPNTGLPTTDPTAGFLPINDTLLHNGEGFFNFRITPSPDSETYDFFETQADIIFDTNDPIATPIIINTIDADAPQSSVNDDFIAPDSSHLLVSWTGMDEGVGIENYTIFYSVNDSMFIPWRVLTSEIEALFPAELGNTYCFISVARDSVGNVEVPGDCVAQVTFTEDLIVAVDEPSSDEKEKPFTLLQNRPNPFSDYTIIEYRIPNSGHVQLSVYNVYGQKLVTLVDEYQTANSYEFTWNGKTNNNVPFSNGIYFYQLEVDGVTRARSMVLLRWFQRFVKC